MILDNNKIVFNCKLEIIKNYEKLSMSKYGFHSNIYKYNEKEIMKIFKRKAKEEQLLVLDILKSYEGDLLSKPILLVEIKNKIRGYTMKFLSGNNLNFISDNVLIENMFNFFDVSFEKQISKLSQDKIKIWDINLLNVLYDENENKFHFIDTDSYKLEKKMSVDELYFMNVCEIIFTIFDLLLIRTASKNQFIALSNKLLKKGINTKDLLYQIKEILENESNVKIVSLNDFRKAEHVLMKKYYY